MSTPPISFEQFTALAHRTASRYSHRSEPGKVAYTFLPHTLADFHRRVCAVVEENAKPDHSEKALGMVATGNTTAETRQTAQKGTP